MTENIQEVESIGKENTDNQDKAKKQSGFKKFFFDWIIPIIVAFIFAQLIIRFAVFKITVPTESMVPTVEAKDQIFVTKVYDPSSIKRGDIVVFKSDEFSFLLLKRVIGLPGDKIEIKDGGKVYINGDLYNEPYVKNPDDKQASFVVPQGKYLMLGDNREKSNDARYWNNPYIDGSNIQGKARLRVYPFDRISFLK